MRFIDTKTHGIVDYATATLLVLSPWLFDFADGGIKQWLPILLGIIVILYSLMTDYELGAVRKITMPVHLMLDLGGGVLLAVSPWLFGFADEIYLPHLLIGLFEIAASLTTRRTPYESAGGARPVHR